MTRKWTELRSKMTPEAQARAAAKTEALLVEMQLTELRQAREKTQAEVAAALGTGQAAVSKLERREDMYVSTLREYVEALGGQLRLVATFPEGDIPIHPYPASAKQAQ
ncbi:XRE family transcriptional regulator [Deinococcus sp. SL84]|uniref:XRE family transcriptional regulator n=1 Tax=Deinococcus sp. SL84 TaxID=2994663 RepID=UPI002272A470|nr:XRE family transcriptional regulator [Deinococcus sp. SL84]MCY1703758.1 XRE family transcriptional regulator [Deinococcus sp. SL84]